MTDAPEPSDSLTTPRQPLLLRLLHGATVVAVVAAWLTGFVVYVQHDGRLLPLSAVPGEASLDFHSDVGEWLTPISLLFACYAVSLGRWRLRRASNLGALLALAVAVGSGQLMHEDWLLDGDRFHPIYSLHLSSWIVLTLITGWHVISIVNSGGLRLATSMIPFLKQKDDSSLSS
jgi:hypothetical protein